MKIKFIPADKYPEKSGKYLWRSSSNNVSIVSVKVYDSLIYNDSWFGVVEFGGKSVEKYKVGQFGDLIEFEFSN